MTAARDARRGPAVRTFLIGDIRGYTKFTAQHGDEAASRLAATFAEIAQEGVEAWDGELVELRGDEVLAVFDSPRQALRCSIELQDALADETRARPELPLTVGIGLDAGEAVPVGDGYRGAALNMAARLCSAAAAGDIIASADLVHLAGPMPGLEFEQLPPMALKGIERPVEAMRVASTVGDARAHPVAGLDVEEPLPAELQPIVPLEGRDVELRWLRWHWRRAQHGHGRTVVVSGPPGIGKTRLAAELATLAHAGGSRVRYLPGGKGADAEDLVGGDAQAPTLLVVDDLDAAASPLPRAVVAVAGLVAGTPTLLLLTHRAGAAASLMRIVEPLAGTERRRALGAILRQDPALKGKTAPSGSMLEIDLLGQFRLLVDGQAIDGLRNPRLLAYVVLNRDRNLTREEVAFALWPDSGDAQALTNLRRELHAIRHALPAADRYLGLDHRTIRLNADAVALDVAQFESAVADPAADLEALRAGIERYRGDLLPGIYDDWLEPHRERLRTRFVEALARLADLLEERGEYRDAMAVTRRLITVDALDERAYRGLIRQAAAAGDRSAGVHAYHAFATVLNDELGVSPSRETQAAYEALLASDRPKEAPARASEVPPQNRLVGRAEPWAALLAAVEEARAGRPTMALLTGEPGIGKSRLAEELVRWARTQGVAAAYGRCYAAEGGLVYATPATWLRTEPFRGGLRQLDSTWLTEIARLLPELVAETPDLPTPQPMTESWQRPRLFEAITRAVRSSAPALLVLDDANWSDDDTLEWVHYLLRAEPPIPVIVLLSVRAEELTSSARIHALTLDMRERGGLREIELRGLTADETVELAELAADRPLDAAERATLFEETDGHPLLVVELSRSGLPTDASDVRRASPLPEALRSQGPGHLLPERMRAVIAARLDQLTADARRLIELAAAFGRDFAFDALAAASDLDEPAVVTALDELWQRRLVRERGLGNYDLSHDRIRDVAYAETPPARRRILHRRIAQSLEVLHAPDLDPVAGQIAAHLEAAGQTGRAAELYERAANVAGRVSAFGEVVRSLDRALALLVLEAPSRTRDERELALLFMRAQALSAVAGHSSPRQEAAFVRARELAEGLDRSRDVSLAINGATVVALVAGRIGEAIATGELGVTRLSHPDDESAAYQSLAGAHSSRGNAEAAIANFRAAVERYRPGHSQSMMPADLDPAILARAWGAYALWLNGRTDEALTWSAEAIQRAEALDHPYAMTFARSYAAVLSQLRDDIPALAEHAAAAADLCARYDIAYYAEWPTVLRAWADRETADDSAERINRAMEKMVELHAFLRRPYYLWLLADVHRSAGRTGAALDVLAEALRVANANGEHWWTAEIHRLTGELTANPEEADANLERALATARAQASHALALRAGISIVRRHPERRDLLTTLLAATPSPNERERLDAAELLAPARTTN